VTAPVELRPGELAQFHYDAGLHASCAPASDRHTTGDFTWSERAAGADLRPTIGHTTAAQVKLFGDRPPAARFTNGGCTGSLVPCFRGGLTACIHARGDDSGPRASACGS
jgi:hypothetical protein